ncbi:cAMP-regulated phosphoprotein 21 isoform X2 [Sitophilus oryzae]|uniref:cAMP-regulated phosphoprotein 21 isoform X2 n=2 Tax=Sitophilus oryzae TaxID=7048 RepID=A0A6J2YTA6_SITOR|nr:cAMP-regulated phosphoprotein 21 isoform X2 [Sitophilus oryzae]
MQQRGSSSTAMESDETEQSNIPPSRGRPTSKLKVLGRSHAMREEQSPPREPAAGVTVCADQRVSGGHLQSPPALVLSPSPAEEEETGLERVAGDTGSPGAVMGSTASPRCSPHCENSGSCERLHPVESDLPSSPKCHSSKSNSPNERSPNHKSSQNNAKGKKYCDCQNQNCIKCLKEKGGNNNNHNSTNNNNTGNANNMLFVNKSRGKLKQQSSSQTSLSFESSTGNSSCLSRESSSDCYTDTTGVNLEQFIPETLNRNPKDRALMLRIEEELILLANDKFQTHYKFPPMSSYHRMLVHRCAAYFGMDHNIEQSGKCVVVNKTKNTRIPDVKFKEHIKEIFNDEPPRSLRSILKRDSNSIEDYCFKSPERGYSLESRRSKSFEEREEEYEKARRRIFRQEMHDGSSDDFGWSDMQWSSTESDYSRYRLQPPEFQSKQLRRLLKVHSEETEQSMRPCVAKSYSFGGYGGNVSILTRGDSVMSTHSAPGPRLLTKQDSGASSVSWRLSPSSSGYKSQSQLSESVTPSPTSTPHPTGLGDSGDAHDHQRGCARGSNAVVWAVTDMCNVPKGSIIINPETGKPFKNGDGSIYHYDPSNPPPGFLTEPSPRLSEKPHRPMTPDREKTPTSSPKHEKRPSRKSSPVKLKSSFTNTATSPSLPFSPPLSSSSSVGVPTGRSYPFMQVVNSCESLPQQTHFSSFSNPPTDGNAPIYQQPYIVYTTPYGIPVPQQYDNRIEQPSMPELNTTTYFIPEGGGAPAAQTIAYQSPTSGPYWNQQPISFYPNSPQPASQTPPQRFSVHMQPPGPSAFMPPSYSTAVNYVNQPPGQQTQNPEVVPVFPNQPVQVVYPPSQPNSSVIYQNPPSLIYSQNTPLYQTASYPVQNMPIYPQSTPTPSSCSASIPSTPFAGEPRNSDGFVHLTQGVQHMNLGMPPPPNNRNFVPLNLKCTQFDQRPRGSVTKMSSQSKPPRPFMMGSSQSSTGTNSPAATVIAGYCPGSAMGPGQYRTPPPSTPPTPQFVFHQPGMPIAPRIFRQLSSERGATPNTAKSSRSPTPASDAATHFERQRFMFPTNFYQGMPMPYIVQYPRLVGRGQPNVYRQTPPLNQNKPANMNQNADNRYHNKNRKPKNNKQCTLPPTTSK